MEENAMPMKILKNQIMDNGSHLILADRSECLGRS